MKKILLSLVALLGLGSMQAADVTETLLPASFGIESVTGNSTYGNVEWTSTTTGITYKAQCCAKLKNADPLYFQFRSNKTDANASGLIVTANPNNYKIKSVKVYWHPAGDGTNAMAVGRKFDFYTNSTAYTSIQADLYTNKPTSADGTVEYKQNETDASVDFATPALFWAMRANSGATYADKIEVVYEDPNGGGTTPTTGAASATLEKTGFTCKFNEGVTFTATSAVTMTPQADGKVKAEFTLTVAPSDPTGLVPWAQFNWGEGMVSTEDANGKFTCTSTKTYAAGDKINGAVFRPYAEGQIEIPFTYTVGGKIESEYLKGGATELKPANLKFSATAATGVLGQAFTAPTLTKDTGAAVTYTSSAADVATVNNEGAVVLLKAGTTTITAKAEANATYEAGTASYTLTVTDASTPSDGYATLAAWLAAKPADNAKINEALTTVFQNGKDLMVTAGGAWALVRFDATPEAKYTNGQQIPAGVEAKYNEYQGLGQLVPNVATIGAATEGTPVTAALKEISEINANMMYQYVRIEGVTLTAVADNERKLTASDGTNEISIWNRWYLKEDYKAGDNATVYGFVVNDNNGLQLWATLVEFDGEGGGDDPVTPGDNTVTFDFSAPTTLTPAQSVTEKGEAGCAAVDGVKFTNGPASVVNAMGTNKTTPRIWMESNGSIDLRLYAGNTTTVAVNNGYVLTKVEITGPYSMPESVEKKSSGSVAYGDKLITWTPDNATTTTVELGWCKYASGESTFSPKVNTITVYYTTDAGIDAVETINDAPVEYFNLQGIRVAEPQAGQILIRRQGNDVTKVIIR